MECPNCGSRMKTTHTYRAGEGSSTARLACSNCEMIATQVTVIAIINPSYGSGAASIARKIQDSPENLPRYLSVSQE